MRLFKTLCGMLVTDISCVLSAAVQDKMLRALSKIDEVCSHAEDNMFGDFPELPDEYVDVFYGATDEKPRNDIDKAMIEHSKEIADELFKGKGHRTGTA